MINIFRKLFIVLGTLLISIGFFIVFWKDVSFKVDVFNKDVEKSREIVRTVNYDYNIFNKIVVPYKEEVVKFSNSLDFYYDNFAQKNGSFLESIDNIKSYIIDSVPIASRMLDNCKYELNNEIMSQQCSIFSINFKAMIDVYSDMIVEYNKVVEKYNQYAVSVGSQTISLYVNLREDEFYRLYDKF